MVQLLNLILYKDLSRLGRDYIETRRFIDIVFPSMGCRFIALNDGVDTIHKNNEMLVIPKNVMNEFYARDTSKKIRAVRHTITAKTYKISYKSKKARKIQRTSGISSPIALAQKRIATRHRPTKSEEIDLFSGLLFCGDCGYKAIKCISQKELERRRGSTPTPAATTATEPETISPAQRIPSARLS